MALKVGGTEVVDNNRQLKNIATIDSGTVTAFNSALNTDPTKGTLTKTFAQNETAEITLSSNVTVGPVVSATKEVPQTGISTKGNWDVNSTASNYDFHNTAANVTLTPSTIGYDLSAFSYDSKSFNTNVNIQGIDISSDGTRIYYAQSSGQIKQRTLSTSLDISTAGSETYYDQSAQDNEPKDITFKPDGTKMYVTGNQYNQVAQYSLSTAWDITTASYDIKFKQVQSQTTSPRSTQFKSDGTKMYVLDATHIIEYSLSTAWDVSTASYTNTIFQVSGQDSGPNGLALKPDGTKIYVSGITNDKVYQYNFGTAWDLSTLSYSSSTASFSSTSGQPRGLAFSANGGKMYIGDFSSAYIYQFTTGTEGLVLGSGSFASTDVGKRITGNGGDVVLTSTGGAFSTTGGSAFTDSSTIAAGSWSMFGLKSAGDADGITISSGAGSGSVDIDQAIEGSNTYLYSGTTTSGIDVTFKPDGTKMYLADFNGNSVREFNLSTAWDLTTASYVQNYAWSSATYGTQTTSMAFKSDGTSFYIVNWGYDYLLQFNLSTAWDVSTASFYNAKDVSQSSWGSVNNPIGLQFSPDGTKLYMNSNAGDKTVQINLTSAWTINGGQTVAHTHSLSSQISGSNTTAFGINSTGTKVYIGSTASYNPIFQYTLSTPYDLSTISYDNKSFQTSYASGGYVGALYGIYIKPDDSKFYATAYNDSKVHEWSIATFTQPTGQYHVGVTNTSGRIDSSAFTDINGMTAAQSAGTGTVNYAVSTDGRTTWSVAKATDGVRPIVRNNSGTWQYNNNAGVASTYQVANPTYVQVKFIGTAAIHGLFMKPDGTKLYYQQYTGGLSEWDLSTPYDVSTATYNNVTNTSAFSGLSNAGTGNYFDPTGTYYYITNIANNQVSRWTLSTPWDISTLGSRQNQSISVSGNLLGIDLKTDGTKMFLCTENSVVAYNLSTAWDNTSVTSSTPNVTYSLASFSGAAAEAIRFKSDGTEFYILDKNNSTRIYIYSLSTAWDISTASYSSYYQITESITTGRALALSSDGNKMYIVDEASSARTYEYTIGSSAYATTATWANGTVNDELYTLQQALGAQSHNRMDKTQLDAVADANHFATGTSLDLMIALRMDAAASTLPTSDGVTLNYDAAALNEGAVLGTDYDFFHPAANKVQIKSLAAQNLKVRVV